MTEVLRIDPNDPDPAAIGRAAACLRGGGLVAFPTETVYGLGVHATDRDAVLRLFVAKQRPADDPLIVHVASAAAVPPLTSDMPEGARALGARFWPGPLTLVLPRSSQVPNEVTAGLNTVAVRVPSHPIAHALIQEAGIPIAAPSANLFSRPSPTTALHVLADLEGRIDMVIDGGSTSVGVESTVVDLSRDPPVLLRPGAISMAMLESVLPTIQQHRPSERNLGPLPSPGLLSKHYSPRAPLTVYEGTAASALALLVRDAGALLGSGRTVVVLAFDEDIERLTALPVQIVALGSERRPDEVAARLFAALRECDAFEPAVILARMLRTDHDLTAAIADRLRRAAAGRIVQGEP